MDGLIKVSVIIPVFNVEKYLRDCLNSLVNQSLAEIEIICVDDCSTDSSPTILKEFVENYSNVLAFYHKKNGKTGTARNTGIDNAKGEYLIFIDADDFVDLRTLELLYNRAVIDNLDAVDAPNYFEFWTNGKKVVFNSPQITTDDNHRIIDRNLFLVNSGRIWTKIFKRSIFEQNNIRYPENVLYEDNPLKGILFSYIDTIAQIDNELYHYRRDVGITSNRRSISFLDRLETSKFMIDQCKKRDIYKENQDALDYLFISTYFNITIHELEKLDIDINQVLTDMREEIKPYANKFSSNRFYSEVWMVNRWLFKALIIGVYPFRVLKFILNLFLILRNKIK